MAISVLPRIVIQRKQGEGASFKTDEGEMKILFYLLHLKHLLINSEISVLASEGELCVDHRGEQLDWFTL